MPVYDYIDGDWLLRSGFELSDKTDFEQIYIKNKTIDYYTSVK